SNRHCLGSVSVVDGRFPQNFEIFSFAICVANKLGSASPADHGSIVTPIDTNCQKLQSSNAIKPRLNDYFWLKIFPQSVGPLSFVDKLICSYDPIRSFAYSEDQNTAVSIRKGGKRLRIFR